MASIEIVTTEPRSAIAIRQTVKNGDIPRIMGEIFAELMPHLQGGVTCIGPPFAFYHSWSDVSTDVEVGFPIIGKGVDEGRVRTIELPAVKAAVYLHVGPYEKLMDAYGLMMRSMLESGHQPADYMWEEYLNSPNENPPEKLMTKLYWPIK